MCQYTLFDVGGVEIHSIECMKALNVQKIKAMLKMSKIHYTDFNALKTILCILKHVEDVEDRSSTLKGHNAMYVKDVKDRKRTYTHIFAHNFLNI